MVLKKGKAAPEPQWHNRIVGEGLEAPDQLLAHPDNWRMHPAEQQAAMEGALATVGWVQRVVVNRRTGHIVDGHLRVMLALRNGSNAVPVVYVELDEAEERLVLATLDPIAAMAGRDEDKLSDLIDGLDVEHEGLQAMLDALQAEEQGAGGGGGESDGGGGGDNYSEQYGVIVVCEDEAHQQLVYEGLTGDGYNCKVVVT